MTTFKLLKIEFLKQRRGFIWLIVLLIPLGTTVALVLDIFLRGYTGFLNVAQRKGFTLWETLMLENHFSLGWGRFTPLVVSVISSVIYYTEFKDDPWKNLLSSPLKRQIIYLSKFLIITFFTWLLIFFNALGLVLVGKIVGFPDSLDLLLYGKYVLYQSTAIIGILALHNWLSSYFRNILFSVILGLCGIIISAIFFNFSATIGAYFPYNYPFYVVAFDGPNPLIGIYGGIISGVLIFLLGYIEFRRRDII